MTEPDARAESLLAALRAEFGDRLDDEGLARIREQIARVVEASKALAAAPLANGDEPMSVFHAQAKE